jgi:hypothetical protein
MPIALMGLLPILTLLSARDSAAQLATASTSAASTQENPPPLTGYERWQMYVNETYVSPAAYLSTLGSALEGQALNYPRAWGGGVEGYSRRAGSQFGTLIIQNSLHDGCAAALRYEPRYFRCQCKGAWKRTGHALEMTFLTYDQHGHKRLDLPQLIGAYGSSMLSALWNPKGFSPLVQGVQAGHLQVGFVAGMNMAQEFNPEIRRLWPIRKFLNRSTNKNK